MTTAAKAPSLIVTIDTEEEGLWGGRFRAVGNTTENLRALPRFQELCDRFAIRPTYLIDAPVVEDRRAADLLRGWQDEDRCEVGAHCHPWCNPPLDGDADARTSFLCNLPPQVQREKLLWLTDAIEEQCGRRPTSFRAGRYGLDECGARILADLGYVVDSSVVPYTDYSSQHGPNFDGAPLAPYWVDGDLRRPSPAGVLLEVPVSIGYNRRNLDAAHSVRQYAARGACGPLRIVGLLDRTGIIRRIKLSPEQADGRSLRRLADVLLSRNLPCLVLMFHSSSLMAGGSPYVPDTAALERFYERLETFFAYCMGERGLRSDTLSGFATEFTSPQSTSAAASGNRL